MKEQGKGIAIHVVASGLKPGQYGFHMHEKNTMSNTTDDKGNTVIGGGLGGHWDPDNTHKHAGPHGDGHRGDLEMLQVMRCPIILRIIRSMEEAVPVCMLPLFRDYNDYF